MTSPGPYAVRVIFILHYHIFYVSIPFKADFLYFVPDPENFQLTKSNTCFILKHEQMFHIEKEILYGKGRKVKST